MLETKKEPCNLTEKTKGSKKLTLENGKTTMIFDAEGVTITAPKVIMEDGGTDE